ncbi:DUF956 family protein [Atopobacter sp. AH10]|uniref:DUF956 family protein n=1 Tax=Atopobacter sp. AH10 TaxID=2315861 RepID=UPI000EF23FDB|nr:DUF956 family protein [Atopobacter sp. AH10]RLK62413.1 DUF956 family protein [Atopobacter sp. AH10]
MIQSINSKVDLVEKATSYSGLTDYGQIMIGDKGFEFYHDRDVNKYIQIPWTEVDKVIAQVLFKGKWIPRFGIQTKQSGLFQFAARDTKKVLRAINRYVKDEDMVRSLSFAQVISRGLKAYYQKFFHKK